MAKQIGAEIDRETFDFQKYTEFYCKIDVELLKQGMEVVDKLLLENFGAGVYGYLTISSYADHYMARMGVYDNCYQIGGICRDFIQKTIVGG